MIKKLESLTPDQEADMKAYAARTLDKVFKYELYKSASIPKTVELMQALYKICNLKTPLVLLMDSPMGCQIAANLFKNKPSTANVWANVRDNVWANVRDNVWANVRANVGANVWDNVWANVRANVGANVGDNVRDNVGANVGDNVGANVGDNVRDNVWANVWDNVRDNVRANVGDNVWANVGANVWDNVWANVWANVRANVGANVRANVWAKIEYEQFAAYGNCTDMGWVAFYRFFEQYCSIKINKSAELRLIEQCAEQSFLSIQLDGLCIVSKYPNKIIRDEENRLHCTFGYAVEFADGYGQYYIHGRAMPARLFEQEITKDVFLNEENEDIKAGIYEIIESRSEGSMLTFLGAQIVHSQTFIHKNGDMEKMELYKTTETFAAIEDLNGKNNVPLCWLKIMCPSTGTPYLILSDASFDTCEAAAKYARPEFVPNEVPYEWFSRS